jgi:hypothetical protein
MTTATEEQNTDESPTVCETDAASESVNSSETAAAAATEPATSDGW